MADYQRQYERVQRYLAKVRDQNRAWQDYEDDLWSYFQNCWHLKDWVKNDQAVPKTVRDSVEDDVKMYEAIQIAADLASFHPETA